MKNLRILLCLLTLLWICTGCENYNDNSSPSLDREGNHIVSSPENTTGNMAEIEPSDNLKNTSYQITKVDGPEYDLEGNVFYIVSYSSSGASNDTYTGYMDKSGEIYPSISKLSDILINGVKFVSENGLMNGINNTTFAPEANLSRAQLAQILYNKEGKPAISGSSLFTDVVASAWYYDAVTWAAVQGIVDGYGNGLFGPDDNITREQLAVMLWRYAGSPSATSKELHFSDAGVTSAYALDAVRWAVENGILSGKGSGVLDPAGLATRAEAAQMLMNLLGN